jgi:hypothetical protein
MITFEYQYCKTQEEVREYIQECEGKHTQQAIYSTFHDALTQICFGCGAVRSTIFRGEKENKKQP